MPESASNLLKPIRPYDTSMEENFIMYDHMPYIRDVNLCNRDSIALESGNIVKSCRCRFKDPYKIIRKGEEGQTDAVSLEENTSDLTDILNRVGSSTPSNAVEKLLHDYDPFSEESW